MSKKKQAGVGASTLLSNIRMQLWRADNPESPDVKELLAKYKDIAGIPFETSQIGLYFKRKNGEELPLDIEEGKKEGEPNVDELIARIKELEVQLNEKEGKSETPDYPAPESDSEEDVKKWLATRSNLKDPDNEVDVRRWIDKTAKEDLEKVAAYSTAGTAIPGVAESANRVVEDHDNRLKLFLFAVANRKISRHAYLLSIMSRVEEKLMDDSMIESADIDQLMRIYNSISKEASTSLDFIKDASQRMPIHELETGDKTTPINFNFFSSLPPNSRENLRSFFTQVFDYVEAEEVEEPKKLTSNEELKKVVANLEVDDGSSDEEQTH